MKRVRKLRVVGLSLVLAGLGTMAIQADIASNLILDGGFEAITVWDEPNAGSAPWFSTGEGNDGSFITSTDQAHSGSQSVKYTFYYDDGAVVQNLNAQVDTSKSYEASFWMLSNEPSANVNHINAPIINVGLYTSATMGGSYSFRQTIYSGALNSADDTWELFSGTVDGSSMTSYAGEYIQLRFNKPNANVTHKMYIDDTSFGTVIPEPATIGLISMVGAGLLVARRFMVL